MSYKPREESSPILHTEWQSVNFIFHDSMFKHHNFDKTQKD